MTVRSAGALVMLMLVSLRCGGKGPDDPITGSWANGNCFGDASMPADIQSCQSTMRFGADLSFTFIDSRQSLPATSVNPRCTAVRTVTGLKYSTTSMGTLTLAGSSMSTLERKDCANAADNQAATADGRDSLTAGPISYLITNKTLSLASSQLGGDYLRQ